MADFTRVREILRASMTAWAILEVRENQARVIPAPDFDLLSQHLSALDPKWELDWSCQGTGPFVVRVALRVLGVQRAGLGLGQTLSEAKTVALAEFARSHGISGGLEGHWVAYDPEDGPDVDELEAEREPLPSVPTYLPPDPVDPQMEKARRHIEDLVEKLKLLGKGKEATRILLHGYGETLEESRQRYRELQLLIKGEHA